jgi:hypothetical protein
MSSSTNNEIDYINHKNKKYEYKIKNLLKQYGSSLNLSDSIYNELSSAGIQLGGNILNEINTLRVVDDEMKYDIKLDNNSKNLLSKLFEEVKNLKVSSLDVNKNFDIRIEDICVAFEPMLSGIELGKDKLQVRICLSISAHIENKQWNVNYLLYATEINDPTGKGNPKYLGNVQLLASNGQDMTLQMLSDLINDKQTVNKVSVSGVSAPVTTLQPSAVQIMTAPTKPEESSILISTGFFAPIKSILEKGFNSVRKLGSEFTEKIEGQFSATSPSSVNTSNILSELQKKGSKTREELNEEAIHIGKQTTHELHKLQDSAYQLNKRIGKSFDTATQEAKKIFENKRQSMSTIGTDKLRKLGINTEESLRPKYISTATLPKFDHLFSPEPSISSATLGQLRTSSPLVPKPLSGGDEEWLHSVLN